MYALPIRPRSKKMNDNGSDGGRRWPRGAWMALADAWDRAVNECIATATTDEERAVLEADLNTMTDEYYAMINRMANASA